MQVLAGRCGEHMLPGGSGDAVAAAMDVATLTLRIKPTIRIKRPNAVRYGYGYKIEEVSQYSRDTLYNLLRSGFNYFFNV